MLENGWTYFKNLAVLYMYKQVCLAIFLNIMDKRLKRTILQIVKPIPVQFPF